MTRSIRWLLAIAAPLLLTSCFLTPGKFVSTLDIRADRSFTFTYVGEVLPAKTDTKTKTPDTSDADADSKPSAARKAGEPAATADTAEEAEELKTLAEALSREYGFRSVKYIGGRKLLIDYSISGKLDHAFVFPFNPDADAILPFIAIELRGKDKVRVRASGYANQQDTTASMSGLGGMSSMGADASSKLDGIFTLTTNATIISQNQEDGAQPGPDGTKKIVWKANPQTKDAPLAVLQLAPLP